MKIYLNLLPEKKKEEIRRSRSVRVILWEEMGFLFPTLLFVGMLLAMEVIIGVQAEGIEKVYQAEQERKENQELKEYEDKFVEMNSKVSALASIQNSHLVWSGVIRKMGEDLPEGVYFTGISNREYKILLTGKARQREDLLNLQEKFEKSGCFSNVNLPLASLVSKENIDFQMDMDVSQSCLKDQKNVLEKE